MLYDLTHDSPPGEVKLKFNFIILHHPFIFDKVYNFFITFIIISNTIYYYVNCEKNYFKKSCYESKKVCKLLESLQTKPRDLDSFFIKNTKVKTDKKFLLNTEVLRDFFLIFCWWVMEKFLITFSYFKIENFINNIHI